MPFPFEFWLVQFLAFYGFFLLPPGLFSAILWPERGGEIWWNLLFSPELLQRLTRKYGNQALVFVIIGFGS